MNIPLSSWSAAPTCRVGTADHEERVWGWWFSNPGRQSLRSFVLGFSPPCLDAASGGWTQISFRVFGVIRGYILRPVTSPVGTAFLKRARERRFLIHELWNA